MPARSALIFDAHEYEPDPNYVCSTADHPDHDSSEKPADHVQHAPCVECGSAKDAFVHLEEARESGYTLAIEDVAASENLSGKEKSGK